MRGLRKGREGGGKRKRGEEGKGEERERTLGGDTDGEDVAKIKLEGGKGEVK